RTANAHLLRGGLRGLGHVKEGALCWWAASSEGSAQMTSKAVTPVGLNHLVLNVRDLEESHKFWTEIIGFKQVGELKPSSTRPNPPKLGFYSGDHGGGALSPHDLALIENTNLPPPPAEWTMTGMVCAISHIAVTLPSREAWLRQLAFLQERAVKFDR